MSWSIWKYGSMTCNLINQCQYELGTRFYLWFCRQPSFFVSAPNQPLIFIKFHDKMTLIPFQKVIHTLNLWVFCHIDKCNVISGKLLSVLVLRKTAVFVHIVSSGDTRYWRIDWTDHWCGRTLARGSNNIHIYQDGLYMQQNLVQSQN